jgi:hypothetical protein
MSTSAVTKPEVTELEKGLVQLQSDAKAVVKVTTPAEYSAAANILVAIRNYQKDVKNKLNPFVDIAKRAYDAARQEMQKYINQAEELQMVLTRPMEDYKRQERKAAEAETRRINEERRQKAEAEAAEKRKADEARAEEERKKREKEIKDAQKAGDIGKREADKLRKETEERERLAKEEADRNAKAAVATVQDVKVQPAIPKNASLRGRVNYYAEAINEDALIKELCNLYGRIGNDNAQRWLYLRKFVIVNAQALGKEAREVKDSKKLESQIPGIRAWDEDSI